MAVAGKDNEMKKLERFLRGRKVDQLKSNKLMIVKQHGCLHKRSSLTTLISILGEVTVRTERDEKGKV